MNLRILLLCVAAMLGGCDRHEPSHDHQSPASAEFERGPHRGRMLRDGDFALEVTLYETGVPPEFRLYAYRGDKPLPPDTVQVTIELSRLDGELNSFDFTP